MQTDIVSVEVLTVDDSLRFLRAARDLIAATPGFRFIGEARSGEEAIAAAERLRPDLVLVDVRMPVMDGIETARRLVAARSHAVVVLMTADELVDQPRAVRACGARAIVRKDRLSPSFLQELWWRSADVTLIG